MRFAKKLIGIAFFISLLTFPAAAEQMLSIGLLYGSTAPESLTISCEEGMLAEADGMQYGVTALFTEVTATINDAVIVVKQGDAILAESANEILLIGNGILSLNGTQYRGNLHLLPEENGGIRVINRIDMESYLRGVVPKEVSASWHEEALKAQAVCARTYTLTSLGKHNKYGFDLCSTVDCQAYAGVAIEHERTDLAIEETQGEVVKYDGELAEVFYFSTSGGHTEDCKNVWSADLPYLKGVPDPYEATDHTYSNWEYTYTLDELTAFCAEKEYDIGNVKSVAIDEMTPNGSVLSITITGDAGEKTVTKGSATSVLGYGRLMSQAYTVSPVIEAGTLHTTAGETQQSVKLLSASGVTDAPSRFSLLSSAGISARESGRITAYTFTGKGWGHRIGMSQNGSKGMAEAGFSYQDILKHYFTGVEITK